MKKINERKLTRQFIDILKEDYTYNYNYSYDYDSEEDVESDECMQDYDSSDHNLDPDGDGIISKEDLYNHFDLNNDGQVTTDEYKRHIEFHCKHPESLSHYNTLRSHSIDNVSCKNSYDSCSQHLLGNPDGIEDIAHYVINGSHDDISKHLTPLMDQTGATCQNSSVSALLDVLQSLVNCGVLK